MNFEYSVRDITDYFRGNFRYWVYYSKHFKWLMRPHIRDQITVRIEMLMDKECYNQGFCKVCGCTTTNLQMANKSCEGNCYPPLMNSRKWYGVRPFYMVKKEDIEELHKKMSGHYELGKQ